MIASLGSAACGADWPTWRHDASRSAVSPENLPDDLQLQWSREFPRPLLAWPDESRLHFDVYYEPVVAGKLLLLGSPNDGSVRAFQTESGAEQWRFFCEGPVRFAPAVCKDKVYFGSDDGWLYCLALADGKLVWKFRVAPDDGRQGRHLGNNRLISYWPVRGGPVVVGDTLYAAAGLWPALGVFVVAVDAPSGKLLWRNSELNYLPKVRIDHNMFYPSALSPQGYMLAAGGKLLMPNGRSMPAFLDCATGKLTDYIQGYRNGDCQVTASDKLTFVGQAGVVDLRTGREVNSRWASAGKDAPGPEAYSKAHLFEATLFPYKFFPGCTARSALAGTTVYDLQAGIFLAYDTGRAKVSEYDSGIMGPVLKPWRWDPPLLGQLPTELAAKHPGDSAIICAGNRLYGYTGQTLLAAELSAGGGAATRVVWKQPFSGTAAELLAADGKLFAVSAEGCIACFGAAHGQPKSYPLAITPLQPAEPGRAQATKILKLSGANEGYCILLGLGEEGLAEQLLLASPMKLIAVDADHGRVDRLRQRLLAAGLYGVRADVFCDEPRTFVLPPYLANLLVAEGPQSDGPASAGLLRQWFDVLRPYGGTAYLTRMRKQAVPDLPGAQVSEAEQALLIRRPGPLPDSAPWTHECADAATSYFSHDQRVRPPLTMLWYGDGPDHGFWSWHDYNTGVKPQVIGGRLFAMRGHRELIAYDVYTGRLLWSVLAKQASRCASLEDGVYLAGVNRCVIHDPASGRPLREYHFEIEPGQRAQVTNIRVAGDIIALTTMIKEPEEWSHLWDNKALVVLDRGNGRRLWTRRAPEGFHFHAVALGPGKIFCIESPSRIKTRKGDKAADPKSDWQPGPSRLLALEARSGKTLWSANTANHNLVDAENHTAGLRDSDDWLGYCRELDLLLSGKTFETYAFHAADGKPLWHEPVGAPPVVLCGDKFFTQQGLFYDMRTGKRTGRVGYGRRGCNYAVANQHLVMLRDGSASYVDIATNKETSLFAVRSGCSNSLIAADGLLNAPCYSVGCVCNYPMQTSFALVPTPAK
jgi:outer membrane protein assembly factor BamB